MRKDFYIVTLYIETEVEGKPFMKKTEKKLFYANNREHAIRKAFRYENSFYQEHGFRDEHITKASVIYVREKVDMNDLANTAKWLGHCVL